MFEQCVEATKSLCSAKDFIGHFEHDIVPLLKNNLQAAAKTGLVGVTTKLTNNNCERLNHVLKQAVDWCPQALSELGKQT